VGRCNKKWWKVNHSEQESKAMQQAVRLTQHFSMKDAESDLTYAMNEFHWNLAIC